MCWSVKMCIRDSLSEGDIYALIIPIQYHVTKKEIQTMAQAENMEQVYGVIKNSWYKCQDIEGLMEHGLGNGAKELTDKILSLIHISIKMIRAAIASR